MIIAVNYDKRRHTMESLLQAELRPYYSKVEIDNIIKLVMARLKAGPLEIFPGIILPHIKVEAKINNHLNITVLKDELQSTNVKVVVFIMINENDYSQEEMTLVEQLMYKLADENVCMQLKQATSSKQITEIIGENYANEYGRNVKGSPRK